jgi:hypothetical protein
MVTWLFESHLDKVTFVVAKYSVLMCSEPIWFTTQSTSEEFISCKTLHFFLLEFYFILFYFIFCFILFYFILFYFILFYFILFYFILFYFILFYFLTESISLFLLGTSCLNSGC